MLRRSITSALGLTGTLSLLALGCAPGSRGEQPASTREVAQAQPAGASGAGTGAAANAGGPAPTPLEPAGALAEAEPEIPQVDSELRARTQVAGDVQPGLAQFAAELDAGELEELGLEPGGSLWVGKLEGNGGRDVLIYIPPGADDAAPFELVFHFHGTYSEVVAKQRPDMKKKREWVGWDRLAQVLAAITQLQGERPPNVALVYPMSAGKRLEPGHQGWSNIAYDLMWMDGVAPPDYRDDFDRLHEQSVAILTDEFGVHPSKLPRGVIAEGHSAGGVALLNIARQGSAHVREYIFLDASFQDWADGCHAAVRASGSDAKLTLVVTDKGMADPFEGREPWCVDMAADAELWKQQRSWCGAGARTNTEVPGSDWTCAELEERAQAWREDYADWCAAMRDNMQSVPEVLVVETKVFHKNQPRHFSGGLELDPDRWSGD